MFNESVFQAYLATYRKKFAAIWKDEQFKWEAVQQFQDNWDENAPDFAGMLDRALTNDCILASKNNFPRKAIIGFAQHEPETVRHMFLDLFDESQDVIERIQRFKNGADPLLKKYGKEGDLHYQYENAISIYLWLRYPDKYYFYKFSEIKACMKKLGCSSTLQKGASAENIRTAWRFCDALNAELRKDSALLDIFHSNLEDTCYPDPELHTLTFDFVFYVGKGYLDFTPTFGKSATEPTRPDLTSMPPLPPTLEAYGKSEFLNEVFMYESRYQTLVGMLKRRKNIILQGAPGVGKTFAAKRLAWSMMGAKDEKRIEFVQFHQNYAYEDFMLGYKPTKDGGFELKEGVFYQFCQRAKRESEKDFFFIIDEINRGNMSKIFGELLMLIEREYRGKSVTLAYDGREFAVPENVYLIGMMNTADRSLALIDYALRRRFCFFEMEPGFKSDGFQKYRQSLGSETFDTLVSHVIELNKKIAQDKTLGKGFQIGHSYFCNMETDSEKWLPSVVEYEILPMLREYWFDDNESFQYWENTLRGVFQ